MRYVLDTHALVWYLTGDVRLGAAAQHILTNGDNQLIIPAIVLAEAKHIADRKRVPVPFSENYSSDCFHATMHRFTSGYFHRISPTCRIRHPRQSDCGDSPVLSGLLWRRDNYIDERSYHYPFWFGSGDMVNYAD